MKIQAVGQLLAFGAAALALGSCDVARQVPFNEADFKWAAVRGSGAVDGRAFIEMRDKSVNVGSNQDIEVYPVNPYTTEFIRREFTHGAHLAPHDPRMQRYVSTTTTDANGNFSVRGLAPGEYYVASAVPWVNHYWFPDADNNLQKVSNNHVQYTWSDITVKNGWTVHVTDWNQGWDRNLDDTIH